MIYLHLLESKGAAKNFRTAKLTEVLLAPRLGTLREFESHQTVFLAFRSAAHDFYSDNLAVRIV